MSGILVFKPADVIRVVEHAIKSTKWRLNYGETEKDMKPCICLVHDHGVYLMSGGNPRDLLEPNAEDKGKSFVTYAKGCDPNIGTFDEWWETSRALVGGDDFGEFIYADWFNKMLVTAQEGRPVRLKMKASSMELMP